MLRLTTQLRNKHLAGLAACLLVFFAVFRFPVPFGMIRLSMQILFEAVVVIFVSALLWHRVNRWVAYFLMLSFLSMLVPFYGFQSHLAFHALMFFVIWYAGLVLAGKDMAGPLLDAMCVISGAHTLFQVLQALNIDPLFVRLSDQTVGLMANPNEVSALHAFCFAAFLRPGRMKFILVPAVGLVLARSFGGVVAVSAGMLFYAWMKHEIIFALILVLVGVALYAFFVDLPGVQRWPVWRKAMEMYREHWIFGAGIGHWKIVFHANNRQGLGSYWDMAHNDFLQALFEMGIGFVLILAGYIRDVVRRYGPASFLTATAIIIIAVNMMVGFPIQIAPTAAIAVTWLAVLETTLLPRPIMTRRTIL